MSVLRTYLVQGIVTAGLLCVACTRAEAQMMRGGGAGARAPVMMAPSMRATTPGMMSPSPTMTSPQSSTRTFNLLVLPGVSFPTYNYRRMSYPQMYPMYMPSYSYGGYGSYGMPNESYGSYGMPSGGYGANYDTNYGSGSSRPSSEKSTDVDVVLGDNFYQPFQITVPAGTTVRWKNGSRNYHTVTSDTGDWGSPNMGEGEIFGHSFTKPGTYSYHCIIHQREMHGVVIVK
jgi:plastocyanin